MLHRTFPWRAVTYAASARLSWWHRRGQGERAPNCLSLQDPVPVEGKVRNSGSTSDEEAARSELKRSIWLLIMIVVVTLLVTLLLGTLPLKPGPRTSIPAWLLVLLALYCLYAGMGYWPLLMLQLVAFSCAATLLTGRAALVILSVHRLAFLRQSAGFLILIGAGCALVNLGLTIVSLVHQRRERERVHRGHRPGGERDG